MKNVKDKALIGLLLVLLSGSYSCSNTQFDKRCTDFYAELGETDLDKDCFCEGVNDEYENANAIFYVFGSVDFEEFSEEMKLKGIKVKHLGSIDLCEQSRIEGVNSVVLKVKRIHSDNK